MKKKRFVLVTSLLSAIGVLAVLGHHKQIKQQEQEEAIVKEVRDFFAGMGTVEVVYTTSCDVGKQIMTGGVVFDDKVVFTYRYDKGQIDYKLAEDGEHEKT